MLFKKACSSDDFNEPPGGRVSALCLPHLDGHATGPKVGRAVQGTVVQLAELTNQMQVPPQRRVAS